MPTDFPKDLIEVINLLSLTKIPTRIGLKTTFSYYGDCHHYYYFFPYFSVPRAALNRDNVLLIFLSYPCCLDLRLTQNLLLS